MAPSRKKRIEDRIKALVSNILLFELQDPRMGFITVTAVELSGDLKRARVMISVMGDEKAQKITLHTLAHAEGYVQKLLGEKLSIKYLPSISFELDDSIKKSIELSKMLRESRENENVSGEEEKSR